MKMYNLKLYNFSTQKMRNYLFEAMDIKSKTISQFTALEKRIIKLKLIKDIHNKILLKILDSEKFNIDKKYNYLLGINKLYNNVRAKYRKTINLYLHYLFDK